ncbi:hypothetical protein [Rhizobium hidalgonense]|uniref:hypothetical protein n=1 Tax=Rhizobium hidalgonense TaxID=1538159 RepID=UPI00287123DB|nr:hypothetical protein [Rhizobium hidalgonense]MDR9805581.1 hypothetical protein [Rhizobium hidalgonense]
MHWDCPTWQWLYITRRRATVQAGAAPLIDVEAVRVDLDGGIAPGQAAGKKMRCGTAAIEQTGGRGQQAEKNVETQPIAAT